MKKQLEKDTLPFYFDSASKHLAYKVKKNSSKVSRLAGDNTTYEDPLLSTVEDYGVCERLTNGGSYCEKIEKVIKGSGYKKGHFKPTGECMNKNGKNIYSILRACCLDVYGIATGPRDADICDFYDKDDPRNADYLWEGCCKRKYTNAIWIVIIILFLLLISFIIWINVRRRS